MIKYKSNPMPHTGKSTQELLKKFEDACRTVGLRITHQRLEVYRELTKAKDHPSTELLHKRLVKRIPTISLDTVYRTLATLAQRGLINKVETVESQARFEMRDMHHHHLICSQCHEILDFQWRAVDGASLPDEIHSWGRIDRKSVVVYGICKACLLKKR